MNLPASQPPCRRTHHPDRRRITAARYRGETARKGQGQSKAEIEQLSTNANVAKVEEDQVGHAFGAPSSYLPVETQPGILAETVPAGVTQINAPTGRPASQGEGVRVAVVGSGIDFNHPDLAANYQGGVNFVPGTGTPMDDNGHGTHCAGTISGVTSTI